MLSSRIHDCYKMRCLQCCWTQATLIEPRGQPEESHVFIYALRKESMTYNVSYLFKKRTTVPMTLVAGVRSNELDINHAFYTISKFLSDDL